MTDPILTPAQSRALAELEAALAATGHAALTGRSCIGKTMIVDALAKRHDARVINFDDCLKLGPLIPLDKWGERVLAMLDTALDESDMLVLDDFDRILQIDGGSSVWPLLVTGKKVLIERAKAAGKRVVLAGRPARFSHEENGEHAEIVLIHYANQIYEARTVPLVILPPWLDSEDMVSLAKWRVGPGGEDFLAGVDFDALRDSVARMTPRQFLLALDLLDKSAPTTTAAFAEAVAEYLPASNVNLGNVEMIQFDDLPGTEAIAEALETHVAMPFEHPEEARRLGFKARRGVMLFGPPGTGKTSIGRALAHRMKGKFFLLDGSIGTEPPHQFIARAEAIIDRATRNTPSVLFIDDADSLLSISYAAGVVRRLLSLMDGMESDSASKICVMMTVMDPTKIPDALVRSGRVELWLETFPPDEPTRARIFARWQGEKLPGVEALDFALLAGASAGFTPADIRRVMDDARLLLAADRANGATLQDATHYALQATEELKVMRARMATILNDNSLRVGTMQEMAA